MGKLNDIVTLARAGYKMDEIKALMEADAAEPEPQPEPTPQPAGGEPEQNGGEPEGSGGEPEQNGGEPEGSGGEPEQDFKALYEESQKTLAALQQANVNREIDNKQQSDADIIADLVSTFI